MSEYDFITDGMVWSYSRVSTFEQCPYAWKLTYIDGEPSTQNYFSQFGLVLHDLLEDFWNGDLDLWDLPMEFDDKHSKDVTEPLPHFLVQYATDQKNFDGAMKFLEDLDWNRDEWEVLGNETTINCEYKGLQLTIRPDLIAKNKETGLVYLIDYKTSNPFNKRSGKPIQKKIDPYWKQLSLYAYFIEKELGIKIDKLRIYFPKLTLDKTLEVRYTKELAEETLDWWHSTALKAIAEEEFLPNVDNFFCGNLCGVRNICHHWDRGE